MGHLHHNAGAVTGGTIAPGGAAMGEIDDDLQSIRYYGMGGIAFDIANHAHTTAIVFVGGIIEAI